MNQSEPSKTLYFLSQGIIKKRNAQVIAMPESEKLIPKMIYNILNNKPLPIYGKGLNSREWIYVDDHCEALEKIYKKGKIGNFYNIGSNYNLDNISVAKHLIKVSKKYIKSQYE